jgi:hypothetical protein
MRIYLGYWFAAPLLVALAAPACTHDDGQSTVTTTTGAIVENGHAVETLASARCERQAECNDFGNGPYATKGECRDGMRHAMADELNANARPRGIDKVHLDRCVERIRDTECHRRVLALSAYPDCRPDTLCARYDVR